MYRTPDNFNWDNFDTNALKPFLKNDLFEGIIGKSELKLLSDEGLIQKSGTVLIGIHDPDSTNNPKDVTDGFDDVLELNFWDIEEAIGNYDPITNEQGKIIRDFILRNKDKRFLVHCHAGMSRSSGVACAVECLVNYNGCVYTFKTSHSEVSNHPRYFVNWTVFDKVMDN